MDFQFYFKRMNTSESLKSLAERKLTDRLSKYIGLPETIYLTFHLDAGKHSIHCSLKNPVGSRIYAEASSDSMYAAIDILCNKVEAQLHRHKSKKRAKDRLHHFQSPEFFAPTVTSNLALDDSIDAADIIKLEAAIKPYRERYLH